MSENLKPTAPIAGDDATDEIDSLRLLSRSPHPYHRQNFELLHPADQLVYRAKSQDLHNQLLAPPSFSKEATPSSDSGTEADDEHFLKGLPAPKVRLHKGLRGKNEPLSGSSTPQLAPVVFDDDLHEPSPTKKKRDPSEDSTLKGKRTENIRRRREIIRRLTEVVILACLGGFVGSNRSVKPTIIYWRRELIIQGALVATLLLLYPLRLILWAYRRGAPSTPIPIKVPSSFDPAPVFYPPTIPILVSLLISVNLFEALLPNLVLSICCIPGALIPTTRFYEAYNPIHWMLTLAPLIARENSLRLESVRVSLNASQYPEVLVALYPLHQTICRILHHLTTTSLLPAELQLLSVALINILLLAKSPQVVILKSLLWVGGLGVTILCGPVIRWGIALARVPKWRFRRLPPQKKTSVFRMIANIFSMKKMKYELLGSAADETLSETGVSTDEEGHIPLSSTLESMLPHMDGIDGGYLSKVESVPVSPEKNDVRFNITGSGDPKPPARRFTLPISNKPANRSKTHTPSGRRKRSASSSVRSFFTLTQAQATMRKWIYASWVYLCVIGIILIGVRVYVQRYALDGKEPVGWALGYMFGDIPWFRFQVVNANLERWVCLPPRYDLEDHSSCSLGWVQHLRHAAFGEANTRLVLSAYWLAIIVVGLAVVFQLSPIYEVDTRRKIFHFMMVAMFLPATFVDPTYAALALSLILAVFLLLDLLRASQLPPLSKPIAAFLTPYVDGRDLRGPVVISHIFLLIGCAIPLWLSLASLPRTGSGFLQGWEVPTREVSMVAGVVCVGLGDAAASLIGRRWGVRKWLWGGGKSIEGSVAFATAVFIGLMAANVWLRIGGWPMTSSPTGAGAGGLPGVRESLTAWRVTKTMQQTGVCASMASLTEAVLTGGNDNVVVPVVLWTCVKSFGI